MAGFGGFDSPAIEEASLYELLRRHRATAAIWRSRRRSIGS
jgi:hypothetical protein